MFLLPIIAYLLFLTVYFSKKRNIVESVVVAWLFITLCAWIIMELFSVFGMVNRITTLVSWCVICLVLTVCVIKSKSIEHVIGFYKDDMQLRHCLREHKISLISLVVFCIVIVSISLLRSQSLLDNLYHRLTKIMHWMQDGKVRYFATWTPQEIKYANLTEYMMAQVYLLGGSDRLISVVQAGAYICSGCCIYGISRKIGVSFKFALLSMCIFFLTPIVAIETITSQTDVVAGFYLLSFVYFLIDYIHADHLRMNKASVLSAIYLSASVMFGYLAKPTVCFAMVVFFIWMCIVRLIKRDQWKVLLQYVLVGMIVAVILFLPDVIRNYEYKNYKDAYSLVQNESSANTTMVSSEANRAIQSLVNPKKFAVVCVSNLAANATSRCFPRVNDLLKRLVDKCKSVLDYYETAGFQVLVTSGFGETNEPSPTIMLFLMASWLCILTRFSKVKREQFLYLLCGTIGLIVQSGIMDYTLFRQRYLIGIMAVLCPAFVAVLENIRVSFQMRINIVASVITVCSLGTINMLNYEILYVIFGFQGDEIHQYIFHDDDAELYYQLMLDHINEKGYNTVGMCGDIGYEYILWQEIDDLERMEHVNVPPNYQGAKLEDSEFLPECIVKEVPAKVEDAYAEEMYCHGQKYVCEWKAWGENHRNYVVFVPGES